MYAYKYSVGAIQNVESWVRILYTYTRQVHFGNHCVYTICFFICTCLLFIIALEIIEKSTNTEKATTVHRCYGVFGNALLTIFFIHCII